MCMGDFHMHAIAVFRVGLFITLGLCLGWKGQRICCVTRGREVEGRGRGGEGRGWEGREGGMEGGREGERGGEGRGGEGRGGEMTVIHILMAPRYLYNNRFTYYVIT